MNKKGVRWLYDELPELVAQGIVTSDAATRLREHYGEPKDTRRSVALAICAVFGALLIGLGVILVFAHNWEELSRPMRVVLSLAPLLFCQVLAGWTLLRARDSAAWCEGTATAVTLAVAAAISLVGQTYNLTGDPGTFMLAWMLLTLPLAYLLNASVPAVIYLAGITSWTGYIRYQHEPALYFWILLALFLPFYFQTLLRDSHGLRTSLLSWGLGIAICVAVGINLDGAMPGLWIIVFSGLLAVMHLSGTLWFGEASAFWQRPFQIIGGRGIVVLSFILTFDEPWRHIGWRYLDPYRYNHQTGEISDYILATALTVLAISMAVRCVRVGKPDAIALGAAPVLAILGFVLTAAYDSHLLAMTLFNLYLLAIGVSAIAGGVREVRLGQLNGGMFIVAALIVVRFFDSDLSIVMRGLVFIALGVGFLLINVWMLRRKAAAKAVHP
jgi:hypothetical protein